VLCNASTANPVALARGVIDVLAAGKLAAQAEPVRAAIALTSDQLAPLAGVYAHPVTGAPTFVTLRKDTLVLGRVNGPVLIPVSPTRFRVTGQPVEVEFTGGAMVSRLLDWPGGRSTTQQRMSPSRPSRAELERYAGSYYSEELGATYDVTATDSTLVLKTRWGTERVVRPAYGDTFAGDFLLSFPRRGGRIDGMIMGSGRVRGVRFTRAGR
jgi:hypothetical protein